MAHNVQAPNIVVSTYAICIIEKLFIRKDKLGKVVYDLLLSFLYLFIFSLPQSVDEETFKDLLPKFIQQLYDRIRPDQTLNHYVMKGMRSLFSAQHSHLPQQFLR